MTRDEALKSAEAFLVLNEELFRGGECEAAYHALMGALHVADRRQADALVERIAERGAAQRNAIEAMEPPHPLSHSQALHRRQVPVYDTLLVHVEAVRLRLKSARVTAGKVTPAGEAGGPGA